LCDLGLSRSDFLSLTPREFDILCKRQSEIEKRWDSRFASVMALLANIHRDSKKRKRPYKTEDFMPTEKRQKQTWQEQLKTVEMITRRMGGEDRRLP